MAERAARSVAERDLMTTAAWREMREAITDELERQHTDDLPDRYVDWIDRDALTSAVMQKIDDVNEADGLPG